MDVNNGNKTPDSVIDVSNSLKDIDLNCNDDYLDDEEDICSAPFEVLAEFLSALMSRDYKTALVYCKLILQYEPNNVIVQDFYPLIQQKINIEADEAQLDSSSSASEGNENSKESEGSTEYYSSTSGREEEEADEYDEENVSTSASLSSSDEEEEAEEDRNSS